MTDEKLIEEAAKAIRLAYAKEMYTGMGFEGAAEAALDVFEKAHAPTDDEREALRVASPSAWGWDECVVCGSKDVTDRGMVVMASKADGAYVGRIAWCDGSQKCRGDLRHAGAFMLTEDQAEAVDAALRHSPAPTDDERDDLAHLIRNAESDGPIFASTLADVILAAGFRRTVQGEPTDTDLLAASNAYMHYRPPYDDLSAFSVEFLEDMRAALRAAGEAKR